eukprot:gene28788-31976_t
MTAAAAAAASAGTGAGAGTTLGVRARRRSKIDQRSGVLISGDGRELSAEERWETAVDLLRQWGDADAARRDGKRRWIYFGSGEMLTPWILKERNNYYRLERALCVLHMTGRKLASMDTAGAAEAALKKAAAGAGAGAGASAGAGLEGGGAAEGAPEMTATGAAAGEAGGAGAAELVQLTPPAQQQFDFRCFFLHRGRIQLYERIAARVEEMVFSGLLDEARQLLDAGIAPGTNNASKAIGYRQAMQFIKTSIEAGKPVEASDLQNLVDEVVAATHKLVRGQMTWFRDDPSYMWLDVSQLSADGVVEAIQKAVQEPNHTGGCGESGRLSREEENALKRHRTSYVLLKKTELVEKLLEHVNQNLLAAPLPDLSAGPQQSIRAFSK